MRMLVAMDVPDGFTPREAAEDLDSMFPRSWDVGTGVTVWTPEEFGLTLADRDVPNEVDGALVDTVNAARDQAPKGR